MEKILKKYEGLIYRVGGSVRDEILGVSPEDYDFVIEQVTPEQFEADYPEFKRVGKDFPVYLVNGNEVALAREEIKTGEKYQDFKIEAGKTIEDDLSRRDFTHGSLAVRLSDGKLVDPHNGVEDIKLRVLRCVNPLAFKEDPIRILRAARFVARFNLVIDHRTRKLIEENVDALKNVTAERLTLEIEKSYKQSKYPGDFFRTLKSFGALVGPLQILTNLDKKFAGPYQYHGNFTALDHSLEAYDKAKEFGFSFSVGVAALFHDVGKSITPDEIYIPKRQHIGHDFRGGDIIGDILNQFRFDHHTVELTKSAVKHHMKYHNIVEMRNIKLVEFHEKIGKKLFDEVTKVASCDHGLNQKQLEIIEKLKKAFAAKVELPKEIEKGGGEKIKSWVKNFRVNLLK